MPKRPTITINTDPLLERVLRAHQWLYERSDGRIGARLAGIPCLLLRTKGRVSGETRTVALAYATDAAQLILVASQGGRDADPGWLKNLRVNPKVEVQIGTAHHDAVARVVERGEAGYERLFRIANENTSYRYFHYQQRTSRPIPVVVLTIESGD